MPWSVQTWLPGRTAVDDDPSESPAFAHELAEFIRGVRAIATDGRQFTGSGDAEWARGTGWAFVQAMGAVWYYAETNRAMSRAGRRVLERILAETDAG